jgi:hypothetical protein
LLRLQLLLRQEKHNGVRQEGFPWPSNTTEFAVGMSTKFTNILVGAFGLYEFKVLHIKSLNIT